MKTGTSSFYTRGFGQESPWIDLVNSAVYDGFGEYTELLDDPAWLRSFVKHWNLPAGAQDAPQSELRELRALLREAVEAADGGTAPIGQQAARINPWIKVAVIPSFVEHQNGLALKLEPVRKGWSAALAAIARSFGESLQAVKQERLKICANEQCKWVFVDKTKGGVKKWCSDATCGNRDRVRRARARQK